MVWKLPWRNTEATPRLALSGGTPLCRLLQTLCSVSTNSLYIWWIVMTANAVMNKRESLSWKDRHGTQQILKYRKGVCIQSIKHLSPPFPLQAALPDIWPSPQHYTWLLVSTLSYCISLVSPTWGLGTFLVHWPPRLTWHNLTSLSEVLCRALHWLRTMPWHHSATCPSLEGEFDIPKS